MLSLSPLPLSPSLTLTLAHTISPTLSPPHRTPAARPPLPALAASLTSPAPGAPSRGRSPRRTQQRQQGWRRNRLLLLPPPPLRSLAARPPQRVNTCARTQTSLLLSPSRAHTLSLAPSLTHTHAHTTRTHTHIHTHAHPPTRPHGRFSHLSLLSRPSRPHRPHSCSGDSGRVVLKPQALAFSRFRNCRLQALSFGRWGSGGGGGSSSGACCRAAFDQRRELCAGEGGQSVPDQ